MDSTVEQTLISQLRTLAPQQVAEVVDFVEFLAAKASKRAALDRLLAIAPALEAAGVQPVSEEEIAAEVKAARAERQDKFVLDAHRHSGESRNRAPVKARKQHGASPCRGKP